MQALRSASCGHGFEPRAQLGVSARARKEAASERAVIKSCPSDDHRQTMTRVDIADDGGRLLRKPGGRVLVIGIGDVDEVVWDAAPPILRQLVGADVEPAIHR